jgi:CheY-like chemotaxis protein
MLSRYDGENNYIMFSDSINTWDEEAILIQEPHFPWEFVQLGNSGSPIETERGWLVITHGVGPMRRYCLSAILLDLEDPTQVIGYLSEPMLSPSETEREGYVPNVVYSCGSIIHNKELIIPYAMADYSSGFATVDIEELFENMLPAKTKIKSKAPIVKPGYRVLLIDDEQVNKPTISQLLLTAGYHVNVASDEQNARLELNKNHFDLILSDIEISKVTDKLLLEILKEHKLKIPVIFLTSMITRNPKINELKTGTVEYIKKPVDNEALLLRFKTLLHHK